VREKPSESLLALIYYWYYGSRKGRDGPPTFCDQFCLSAETAHDRREQHRKGGHASKSLFARESISARMNNLRHPNTTIKHGNESSIKLGKHTYTLKLLL
jgi:hypothetical protein